MRAISISSVNLSLPPRENRQAVSMRHMRENIQRRPRDCSITIPEPKPAPSGTEEPVHDIGVNLPQAAQSQIPLEIRHDSLSKEEKMRRIAERAKKRREAKAAEEAAE